MGPAKIKVHTDVWPGPFSRTSLGKPSRSLRDYACWPTGARSQEQAASHLQVPSHVTMTTERVGNPSPPPLHFLVVQF